MIQKNTPKGQKGKVFRNASVYRARKNKSAKKPLAGRTKLDKIPECILLFVQQQMEHQRKRFPKYYTDASFKRAIDAGALELDRLHRLDKFDIEQDIIPALSWAITHDYWSTHLITFQRLRRKIGDGFSKFIYIHLQYTESLKHPCKKKSDPNKKSIVDQNPRLTKCLVKRIPEFSDDVYYSAFVSALNENAIWYQNVLKYRDEKTKGLSCKCDYECQTEMLLSHKELMVRYTDWLSSWAKSPSPKMFRPRHVTFRRFLKSDLRAYLGFDLLSGVKESF